MSKKRTKLRRVKRQTTSIGKRKSAGTNAARLGRGGRGNDRESFLDYLQTCAEPYFREDK